MIMLKCGVPINKFKFRFNVNAKKKNVLIKHNSNTVIINLGNDGFNEFSCKNMRKRLILF